MELSDSLYSPIPKKEKETLDIMFDRELKREKNLDNAKKAPEKQAATKKDAKNKETLREERTTKKVEELELDFAQIVNANNEVPNEPTLKPEDDKQPELNQIENMETQLH